MLKTTAGPALRIKRSVDCPQRVAGPRLRAGIGRARRFRDTRGFANGICCRFPLRSDPGVEWAPGSGQGPTPRPGQFSLEINSESPNAAAKRRTARTHHPPSSAFVIAIIGRLSCRRGLLWAQTKRAGPPRQWAPDRVPLGCNERDPDC